MSSSRPSSPTGAGVIAPRGRASPFASIWWSTGLAKAADEVLDYVLLALSAGALLGVLRPGVLGLAITIPGALLAVFAGVAVDRFRRYRGLLLRTCDLARAASVGVLLLLPPTRGSGWVPAAYAVLFAVNAVAVVRQTTVLAALPDLYSGSGGPKLRRANGLLASQQAAVTAAAPLAGVVLVETATASGAVAAVLVLFVLAWVTVLPASAHVGGSTADSPDSRSDTPNAGFIADTITGVRALAADQLLRVPLLVNATSNVFMWGLVFALPLLVARRSLPSEVLGVGLSLMVGASTLASLAAARWSSDRLLAAYLLLEPAVQALGYLLLALSSGSAGLLMSIVLITTPQGLAVVARRTFLQVRFEPSVRGRVFGQFMALNRVLLPGAPVLMQLFADRGELPAFFGLAGTTCLLLALALVANPLVRNMARAPRAREARRA